MKKTNERDFHDGATGSVIYVQLQAGPGPRIQNIHSDGRIVVALPDPDDTARLLLFLTGVLQVSGKQLEVVAAGVNLETGHKEKMIAILGVASAVTDARLLKHFHGAANN